MKMNREKLDDWCERGILGLVLAIMVFGPMAFGAVQTELFVVIQWLTAGVLILWAARLWMADRARFLCPPICWAALGFGLYAIARYFTSDIEYAARLELLRVLVYVFLFLAIINNLHRQEHTQAVGYTMIFLALVLSMYGVWQFATKSDRVWWVSSGFVGRASGTYICPNHLAGFLEMLLPLALAYTLVGRSKAVMKVFLGYAVLVMLVAIGATGSRGSWVSCAVALLFFFGTLACTRGYRLAAGIGFMVLALAGGYLVTKTNIFKVRIEGTATGGNLDMAVRMDLWDAAVRMWRDNLWFGVGPGHYDWLYRAYRPAAVQLQADRAHNEYVNTLADWGVTGTAIVIVAFVLLGWGVAQCWGSVRRSNGEFGSTLSNKFAVVIGVAAGMVALLIHSLVDFNMQIPANAILAVAMMAVLSGHWRFATERFWLSGGVAVKAGVSLMLVLGAGYLTWQGIGLGREYVCQKRAERAELFSAEQASLLEKAYAIQPRNGVTARAIGEAYRIQSSEGDLKTTLALTEKAMNWFTRGMTNNPHDGYNYMRYGMCLDWLERHDEAEAFFMKADKLDPNGYFTAAHVGWHYVQAKDYASARPWLERSLSLQRKNNDVAQTHLDLVNQRLLEGAAAGEHRSLLEILRAQPASQ